MCVVATLLDSVAIEEMKDTSQQRFLARLSGADESIRS